VAVGQRAGREGLPHARVEPVGRRRQRESVHRDDAGEDENRRGQPGGQSRGERSSDDPGHREHPSSFGIDAANRAYLT